MSVNLSIPEKFVRRGCAITDGVQLEYLTITVQEERRWLQRARVPVSNRAPDAVWSETREHIEDIAESAHTENRRKAKYRILLYKSNGETCGIRTFDVDGDPDGTAEGDGDGTIKGETLGVIRELRILVSDTTSALTRQGDSGWKMALALTVDNQRLYRENMELVAAQKVLQSTQTVSPERAMMYQMIAGASPMLMQELVEWLKRQNEQPQT